MKLNYKRTILVGFAFFLICAFWQAYDTVIPMMLVNKFGLNQTWSGIVMSLDNVLALFMLPLFGSLSDKTNSKLGKRTPYILVGTIVAVCAFIGLTFADNAQLAKLGEADSQSFYSELFDNNYTVVNAEYSSITNKDLPKNYTVQDYASHIVKGKDYSSLETESEKQEVKSWYISINAQYLSDKTSPETAYYFDGKEYHTVNIENVNGVTVYSYNNGSETIVIQKAVVANAYGNLITPAASSFAWQKTMSEPLPLVCFAILLLVTLMAMSIFRSPAVALMPDVTPKPLRSKANAIINLLGTAGGMLVLVLGMVFGTGKTYNRLMNYSVFIIAVCTIMVVGLIVFLLTVKEKKWAAENNTEGETEQAVESVQAEDGKPNKSMFVSLILILLSVALWYMGYNAVTSKYSLYAANVLHMDYNTTLLLAQAAAIISYLPVGFISEKIGRKKSILIGVAILAIAFGGASFMTVNSPSSLMNVLFALAGIGWATINVNSFPMVVEMSNKGNTGKFTGYYYTASMAAQIITPIFSGFIMDIAGSMRPLFVYAMIFVVLSFVSMLFVKHGDNKITDKKPSETANT